MSRANQPLKTTAHARARSHELVADVESERIWEAVVEAWNASRCAPPARGVEPARALEAAWEVLEEREP
jgi:hypothetical protein